MTMRLPRALPLAHDVCTTQHTAAENNVPQETIHRVAKDKKRKRQTTLTTVTTRHAPVKKEPRLSLHAKDVMFHDKSDSILALIGDDPPKFWPQLARRMWYYCQKQHYCSLLTHLTIAVTLAQQERHHLTKGNDDVMSVVMEYLIESWGAPVLTRVWRCVVTTTTIQKSRSGLAVVETATTKQNKCGKSARDFVDLTTIDDEEQEQEESKDVLQGWSPSSVLAPWCDLKRTVAEKKTIAPNVHTNESANETDGTVHLKPHADGVSLAMPQPSTQLRCPPPQAATNTVDTVQMAIAYGFDLARRCYATEGPAIVMLCQEAARTVRFMSPKDRQRMWAMFVQKAIKKKLGA